MRLQVIVGAVFILSSAGQSQPSAPRLRMVEELRLDAAAEDFPTVSRVFVGPRGLIVVPITTDMQLRLYDSTGKRIAAVGRRGAGPGEFFGIALVGWIGDTLWASDMRQRRTTFVGPDHKVLNTVPWPDAPAASQGGFQIGYFSPVAFLPDGSIAGQGLLMPDRSADPTRMPGGVLAIRAPNGATRIVYRMPDSNTAPWMMWSAGFGRNVPFSLSPQYAFSRDGSRFAQLSAPIPARQEGTFTVTMFRTLGDTVFSRTFPFRGASIPRKSVDSALALILPPSGRPSEGPADNPQKFQAMARDRMSKWYIPVETILLGLDHTVWIGMRPTPEGRGYLVLSPRGDPIGSLMVPRSTRVRQATTTRIWVTETDEDGLSSVVRYRLSGITCGPPEC